MKKLLFFDYRELEHLDGFTRAVEPPVKHPDAPLLTPGEPWEHGNLQLYWQRDPGGGWSVSRLVPGGRSALDHSTCLRRE